MNTGFLGPAVATVLTACGIETQQAMVANANPFNAVATVLTACGIETENSGITFVYSYAGCNSTYRLRY